MSNKAIVLLSGGLDSTTVLAKAKSDGFDVYAMSFVYGQRHEQELKAARRVASSMGVQEHLILELPLWRIGGSALTDDIEVPKDREEIGDGIPLTYVPARNTLFLSYALAWAEVLPSQDIYIGVSAVDYSGYPDCRPEFISAFENMANLATRLGVEGHKIKIHTPIINLNKAETVKLGISLGVDYSLTHTCYDPLPDGRSCGRCDSCRLRLKGFYEAGIPDPIEYAYIPPEYRL